MTARPALPDVQRGAPWPGPPPGRHSRTGGPPRPGDCAVPYARAVLAGSGARPHTAQPAPPWADRSAVPTSSSASWTDGS